MPQKFRVEVSQDLHRALKLSAELNGQDLRDYAAPFLEAAIDPRIAALLAEVPKEFCDIAPQKDAKYHRTKAEPRAPGEPGLQDPVTLAKAYILAELEEGREPTAAEVAEAVGMESRPLGRLMKAEGLEARNVHRGGVKARRYTLEMLDIIKPTI